MLSNFEQESHQVGKIVEFVLFLNYLMQESINWFAKGNSAADLGKHEEFKNIALAKPSELLFSANNGLHKWSEFVPEHGEEIFLGLITIKFTDFLLDTIKLLSVS